MLLLPDFAAAGRGRSWRPRRASKRPCGSNFFPLGSLYETKKCSDLREQLAGQIVNALDGCVFDRSYGHGEEAVVAFHDVRLPSGRRGCLR